MNKYYETNHLNEKNCLNSQGENNNKPIEVCKEIILNLIKKFCIIK